MQRVLPGISTEQLRSRLNRMVADGMLTRQRYREVPPRVDYELTERSRELAPVLGELARWGYEWAWGPPRPNERVDLGAIFRLIPGLVSSDSAARGTVELIVSDGDGDEPLSYMVTLSPGAATISERQPGPSDAQIRGSSEAWIQALSPQGEARRPEHYRRPRARGPSAVDPRAQRGAHGGRAEHRRRLGLTIRPAFRVKPRALAPPCHARRRQLAFCANPKRRAEVCHETRLLARVVRREDVGEAVRLPDQRPEWRRDPARLLTLGEHRRRGCARGLLAVPGRARVVAVP